MAFKNIVVVGASGMLGQELTRHLKAKGYTVFSTSSDTLNLLVTEDEMKAKLEPFEPEVIIQCAAFTNVDGAERDPDLAMAINKDGTHKLGLVSQGLGAVFAYISTDYVFDGLKSESYLPTDRPNPINTYGLSKYYGELLTSEQVEAYYIIRTSWLYGIHRNNFVQWVLDQARVGGPIKAAEDWIGTPTWTGNLVVAIENIINSGAYGTYHAADSGVISRYEQALQICRMAGLPTDTIVRVNSADLGLPANRPKQSPLACPELAVPSWETGFQAYLLQYQHEHMAS